MATETSTETGTDEGFGRVSRFRGILFKYLTFLASVSGIGALAVLLAYVSWDAFGLAAAEPAWYGLFVAVVIAPVAVFILYTRRNPLAGEVALELVSTTLGGVLAGFGLFAVLEVIVGPGVWFAYFVTVVVPAVAVYFYGRSRPDVNWTGLGILGALVVGPIVGTVVLGPLSAIGAEIGPVPIYGVSLVVPAAFATRYAVGDRLELWDGDYAAAVVLVVGVAGVFAVGSVPVVSPTVWLMFLTALFVPLGIVVARNLAERKRWVGFVGPVAFVVGVAALILVPDAVGLNGPSPWFGWSYVTSAPSFRPNDAGLYPAIIGSVYIIVLVALITLFVGVGAAVYLEEYAPSSGLGGKITRLIRINISNLAGVPSVVYGLLGLALFANILGLGFGTVITAAFTLSLLILPIVIIAAREAVAAVPDSLREASYGMGATRWQTTREVVLPRAAPGVLTGTILALGRAIGETAPLIMVGVATTRFSPPSGMFGKTTAMPMQIFSWSDRAVAEFRYGVVAAGVVTLLIVLLTMNSIAILLRRKYETEV